MYRKSLDESLFRYEREGVAIPAVSSLSPRSPSICPLLSPLLPHSSPNMQVLLRKESKGKLYLLLDRVAAVSAPANPGVRVEQSPRSISNSYQLSNGTLVSRIGSDRPPAVQTPLTPRGQKHGLSFTSCKILNWAPFNKPFHSVSQRFSR